MADVLLQPLPNITVACFRQVIKEAQSTKFVNT